MTSQPLRLLLVEDSPEDAELVLRQVRRSGLECEWKRVDTESDFLTQLSPDLDIILSDYSLPQFSALRALELLQESGYDVPFIIISGTIGEETAVAAMRQGASDYLLKDRLARLGQAMTAALEKSTRLRLHAQAESELRESERRFQLLADTIAEVFWIANADMSKFYYVSPGYQKIWGHSPEELYANATARYEPIVEEDRPQLQSILDCTALSLGIDYRIHHPDGGLRWIHDRAFPVRDASGRITQIVGVASDITERRQLEAEYRHAQKMEALGQLAAGVAHDFNNLLTVISGNATLLQQLEANVQESTDEILTATKSAARLTKQLLMFSRKNMLKPKWVNLDNVVTQLAKMLQRVLGEDVVLECYQSATPPGVMADQGMLEQILVNLVVNARDAMPSGGTLTVATSLHHDEADCPWVRLSVTDTGEGIPLDVLPRLFEPFFTTKQVGKGTGLGLATVSAIVEQHQGRVMVESEVGRGTTFKINLPFCSESTHKTASVEQKGPVQSSKSGETILVVEDDNSVRKLLLRFLRRAGYRVYDAEAGPSALELWTSRGHEIDLLLTDIVLPGGMTGFQIAERLRQDRPALPVIFSSGYGPDRIAQTQECQDGYLFLEKPFERPALIATVREALDSVVLTL